MTRQPHFRPLASTAGNLSRSAARVLTALTLGQLTRTSPTEIVNRNWPTDVITNEYFDHIVMRAASVPASTSGSWGDQLLPTMTGAFLSGLAPQSAAVRLFERAMRLDFGGIYEIHVPRASTSAEPVFVAEGGPMPIVQDVLDSVTVGPVRKMLFGKVFTGELERMAVESATAIISRDMSKAARLALDAAVFSTTAADSTRPAGLLNGVTGQTATAGGGEAAMTADVANLAGAIADGGGDGDSIVLIANARQATALRPARFGYDVFSTTALADGTVVAVDPSAIASGFDGQPEIDFSREATAHMEGTTPLAIGTSGTPNVVAAPTRSFWQADCIGLRLRLRCAWANLLPGTTTGGVAFVTSTTW